MTRRRERGLRERLRELPVFDGVLPGFETDAAPDHPSALFVEWMADAIEGGVREPHAMALATVDAEGRPNSRILILKGIDDGGYEFAAGRHSRKGEDLATRPWAAATFYWSEVGRQVRLRGRVADVGSDAGRRDFLARSAGSRAASLVGRQGQPLHDPADLDVALDDARARLSAEPDFVPEHWAVYRLIPDEAEFWQADPDRRHVRLRYTHSGSEWTRQLLWP